MKKLAAIVCVSSMVFAAPAAQAQWQNNWLVGIGGGWMHSDGNVHLTFNDLGNPATPLSLVSKNISHSGWGWEILGGYQARCNGWLVGVELEVDWMDKGGNTRFQFSDSNNHSWEGAASYKRETNIGLTGRLGFQVSPCLLPYVRAGLETSRDKVSYVGGTDFNIITGGTIVPLAIIQQRIEADFNGSRRVYRGVFGVGLEMPIPMVCGLSLRAEYDYHTNARRVSGNGLSSDRDVIVTINSKQHLNSAIVALVWNFL